MSRVRGLLFDLDGTVADTDPHHYRAFADLLAEHGRSLTRDQFHASISGGSNAAVMQALFPDLAVARHIELADRKEAMFRAAATALRPLAGLPELLERARISGVKVGVVTNAPRLNAEHVLRTLGLDALLEGVVIGEELTRSKPDPLPYLTGLERLGLAPTEAVAFEDSRSGVRSAVAAGIRTVGIATSLSRAALIEAGATAAVDDYRAAAVTALID